MRVAASAVDAAIEQLSRRQHGAFSQRQAISLGLDHAMIDRRRAAGRWLDLAPRVYGHPAVKPTWERQLVAASLVHPGRVAVARSAAAALHGIEGFRRGRPVLVVPVGGSTRNQLARVHRTRHLDADDVCRVSGIPVTTLVRTAIDLAPSLSSRELGRLVDTGVLTARIDLDHLAARTASLLRAGGRSRRLMGEVLEDRLEGYVAPASELEACLFEVLDEAGFPAPTRQFHLPWRIGRPGTVDAAYIDVKALLEADGRAWHTRMEDFEDDHQRDLEAISHGWTPVRVTWRQLQNGAGLFVVTVGSLLERRLTL